MATRKTFVYKIDIESSDSTKELANLELQLAQVTKQVQRAKKANDGEIYEELRKEQLKLQAAVGESRKAVRQQIKDLQSAKFPTDSIIGLQSQYAKLRREINRTGREDPNFPKLVAQAEKLSNQINDTKKSFGDFTSNIGRYEESVTSALQSTGSLLGGDISGFIGGLGIGGAVAAGVDLLAQGVLEVKNLVTEYANLRGEIQRVSDLTGNSLDQATIGVQAIANTFDQDARDVFLSANALAQQTGIEISEAQFD